MTVARLTLGNMLFYILGLQAFVIVLKERKIQYILAVPQFQIASWYLEFVIIFRVLCLEIQVSTA